MKRVQKIRPIFKTNSGLLRFELSIRIRATFNLHEKHGPSILSGVDG